MFVLELILMYHRHHFYDLVVYLAVLGIFMLNYFDMYYIRFCLGMLALGMLLDLVWVILNADVSRSICRIIGIHTHRLNTQLCKLASCGLSTSSASSS